MPWAGGDAWTVQGSQPRTMEGRRGRRPLHPTKLTSGLQDSCSQLLKAELRILPAAGTPWAGLRPPAPLADPVSRRQKQESVPIPSYFPGWREEDWPLAFHLPRVSGWFGRTPRPGATLSGCRAAGDPEDCHGGREPGGPAHSAAHPPAQGLGSEPTAPVR